ncbi:FliI/YscN family ATPase [Angustibacter luteus]|uniref:FliI/YscN family ATPase n=1 Tax=Angustibacter luteus TaxID=658456 RepID=A0ABW1JI79_9ACTN
MSSTLMSRLGTATRAAAPQRVGRVSAVVGLVVEVVGVDAAVGDLLLLASTTGLDGVPAEVVGLTADRVRCMPLGEVEGLRAGDPVFASGDGLRIRVGPDLLGRVLDGIGQPADGGPALSGELVGVHHRAPQALLRQRVDAPVTLGVRALDTLVPAGRGQRLGIFAGSGVGKSSLLSMIARGTSASVSVLALVGERGREVREFVEGDLGEAGLARSVVVVATSDAPAVTRLRAAFVATRIAEWFRDGGLDVLLMMDSLTRVAMAQREIGLSNGEPPATRGYPPSTFALLPKLLERAGPAEHGTITGIYTVLVDGDDHNEPIADAARSILDGHVTLSRRLATAGHFPTIDVLESVSRVAGAVTTSEQRAAATVLRRVLAAHRDARELIEVGAYAPGADPDVDAALVHWDAVNGFLRQPIEETVPSQTSWSHLNALVGALVDAGARS